MLSLPIASCRDPYFSSRRLPNADTALADPANRLSNRRRRTADTFLPKASARFVQMDLDDRRI